MVNHQIVNVHSTSFIGQLNMLTSYKEHPKCYQLLSSTKQRNPGVTDGFSLVCSTRKACAKNRSGRAPTKQLRQAICAAKMALYWLYHAHCWPLKILLELCVSSVELYQWSGHSKDVNEIFRQLMILQSLRSVGQPRGCEKILPSIDFSLESGIPSWDETKYSRSLEHSCLEKRLLSSHMELSTRQTNSESQLTSKHLVMVSNKVSRGPINRQQGV